MPNHLSTGIRKKLIGDLRKFVRECSNPRWVAWAMAYQAALADPEFDPTRAYHEAFGKGAPSEGTLPANAPPMVGIN